MSTFAAWFWFQGNYALHKVKLFSASAMILQYAEALVLEKLKFNLKVLGEYADTDLLSLQCRRCFKQDW